MASVEDSEQIMVSAVIFFWLVCNRIVGYFNDVSTAEFNEFLHNGK
jgi:hypothetical protein